MTTDRNARQNPTQPPLIPDQTLVNIVEAVLFVVADPVSVKRLAASTAQTEAAIETALLELSMACQQRGIRLQRHGDKVQLVTAPEVAPHIERFLTLATPPSRLSTPALETLSIVAYRQPITRAAIEAIRGVNCDGVLRTLLSKGLIEEVGRLDTVGHPALFGTTFAFLQFFGLDSLGDLPELEIPTTSGESYAETS